MGYSVSDPWGIRTSCLSCPLGFPVYLKEILGPLPCHGTSQTTSKTPKTLSLPWSPTSALEPPPQAPPSPVGEEVCKRLPRKGV